MTGDYQVVRVMPDGKRQIMNTISRYPASYWSSQKEMKGLPTTTPKERMVIAHLVADGWVYKDPWPEAKFVVELVQ